MGANAHRTLFSAGDHDTYLRGLKVDIKDKEALQTPRDGIRDEIRLGLRDWSDHVDRGQLFEAAALGRLTSKTVI